jgi:hypothetical protein
MPPVTRSNSNPIMSAPRASSTKYPDRNTPKRPPATCHFYSFYGQDFPLPYDKAEQATAS